MMKPPLRPKIFHILHVDRLASVLAAGRLWCDAEVMQRALPGTTVGMGRIKQRRSALRLTSHPALRVGDCVPFYFCPRSIMLYLISKANHVDLDYKGGQTPIVHLEADLHETVEWAKQHRRRWAFTLSNAGTRYFEDRADLRQLHEIDWEAVRAVDWRQHKEGKQAEFLIEREFPWQLVNRIGVLSHSVAAATQTTLESADHTPAIVIKPDWYY